MANTQQSSAVLSQEPKPTGYRQPLEHHSEVDGELSCDNGDAIGKKKPLAFYLAFLGINITILVFSLDATTLAVAIPVSCISPSRPLFIVYTNGIPVHLRATE